MPFLDCTCCRRWLGIFTALLLLTFGVHSSRAQGKIFYQAFNLTDSTPGQDLWRFSYTVSGFDVQASQGFSVFFTPSLYRQLQSPPPAVNADWNVIAVQPDLVLHDPGFYDAQALRSAPSLANEFNVTFVWLGLGTPGAQPYDIYNADFSTRFSGQTVLVPEPAVPILVVIGFLGWLFLRRAFAHKSSAPKI